jgi:flagellar basal-body rod protein FlgG
MIRALTTAATGLEAQQAQIQRIANDMANVNTDAYKRGKVEFQDLMYETTREPGAQLGAASNSPVGVQTGLGVKVGAAHKIFEQGSARPTARPMDMMINGKGFFSVQLPNGEVAYTRNGSFRVDGQGRVMTSTGALLIPQMTVPAGSSGFRVAENGEVQVASAENELITIGNIQLVNFVNEEGLMALGNSFYKATAGSGQPTQGVPGENGLGTLEQNVLEGSNVNVANSMVDMIQTQRAYEMNTKVMGVADQMLNATVNIK